MITFCEAKLTNKKRQREEKRARASRYLMFHCTLSWWHHATPAVPGSDLGSRPSRLVPRDLHHFEAPIKMLFLRLIVMENNRSQN